MASYIMPHIHVDGRGRSEDGVYEFVKTVKLSSDSPVTLRIFAALRYKLFVNGRYVCEGPCRSSADISYFDTITTDLFNSGENEIKVVIVHITEKYSFTTGIKYDKPQLVLEGRSDTDAFVTDNTWKIFRITNHKLIGNDTSVFPFEDVSGDSNYVELPVETGTDIDFDKGYSSPYGTIDFRLMPRPIPMLYPGEEVNFSEVRRGKNFIEYDAGIYVTANVKIRFAPGCRAKIIYAECYEFEDGKRMRDDTTGTIRGVYDIVTSGKKEFTFESFWFRAFRFIRIETEDTEKVKDISAYRFNYPVKFDGSFSCSDKTYNEMYKISINTMLCCTSEIFVDCPYYEQQQYIMDSAIEASVFMRMTSDVSMVRKCICEFAASQQPCGLLCANYPSTLLQIIPGFSIFWISLLKDYLDYSADAKFVRRFTGTLDKILMYFEYAKNPDGLVTRSREWDFVDWVPGWERGIPPVPDGKPLTVYNLYLAYGLKCASYIAEKCGRAALASEYNERYKSLCGIINEKLYVPEKGMYHDGNGTYSMHTIIWAILSGLVSGDAASEMARKINDKTISKSSYSMNYFLFRALEQCGAYDTAPEYFDGWKKMIDLHCTTWCENPDSPRSECHAWSCAPLYEFSSGMLGVKYSFEDEIIIEPHSFGASNASGTVPTRFGNVNVNINWTADGKTFKITIKSPADIKKRLKMPDGRIIIFDDAEKILC